VGLVHGGELGVRLETEEILEGVLAGMIERIGIGSHSPWRRSGGPAFGGALAARAGVVGERPLIDLVLAEAR